MGDIDSIDRKIINLLEQDALRSRDVIAKNLGVSYATVRRRINKLIKNKTLQVVARVDPSQAGDVLMVIVAFDIEHDKLSSAMKSLSTETEIKMLATTTGRFDIIAIAVFVHASGFIEFIQKTADIDGVKDSETFVCVQIEKGLISL